MKTRLIKFFGCLVIFVFLSGWCYAKPFKLKFATIEPPQALLFSKVHKPWIDRINRDSEGTLQIDIYPGGVLGRRFTQQIKMVKDGIADLAWSTQFASNEFPDEMVAAIPFLANNSTEASLAMYRLYKKGLLRGYNGLKVLGIFAVPQQSVHTTFPVKSVADIKGRKFRVSGALYNKYFNAFGAVRVALPFMKIAEGLSRGVLEGTQLELVAIKTFRIYDVAKYHTMIPLGSGTTMICMTEKRFEQLPEKAKAAIEKHSGEVLVRNLSKVFDDTHEKILQGAIKDPEHTVFIPKGNQLDPWKNLTDPIVQEWINSNPNGRELVKAFINEVEKVRSEK